MRIHRAAAFGVVCSLITVVVITSAATWQSSRPNSATSSRHGYVVTAALVAKLPLGNRDYVAAVLRRDRVHGGDVILLPASSASASSLDAAVRTLLYDHEILMSGRQRHDRDDGGERTLGVRLSQPTAEWKKRMTPRAQRVVDSLRDAPLVTIDGIGSVRAVTFHTPAAPAKVH